MNCENETILSENCAEETARKTYQTPKLVIYGNISEITQALGMNGMMDGGGGGINKTG